jgi:thimet oligopeptidase
MLEEWAWDATTLQTFARHYQTDEPIPAALVQQMKRAKEFGKGLHVRRQMLYAKLSLSIHERDPREVDTDRIVRSLTEQYMPFPFVEGTHFQTAFGHLDGYSAMYYTYMWSLVIAKDLFSKFDRQAMLVAGVARQYGETVLAPGGSRPAAEIVREFLGRPFDFAAYQAWLDEGAE